MNQRLDLNRTYGSHEIVRFASITYRQLQWWDEQDVVNASHDGHRRVYTAPQALEIRIISGLRRKGYSLQAIRRIRRQLTRAVAEHLDRRDENVNYHLVMDGDGRIKISEDPGEILLFLRRSTLWNPIVLIEIP
jgi:DNA-binding transcriptional MerR regulator